MRLVSIAAGVFLLLFLIMVSWLHRHLTMLPLRMDGWAAPAWRSVAFAFRTNLQLDLERGASLAVYHKGELVVDLLGGYMDMEHGRVWTRESIGSLLHITKGLSALCMIKLADDGHVNLSALVTDYWPEFSFAGKTNVTIDHILSHQSGVIYPDGFILREDLHEDKHDKIGRQLARALPSFPCGQAAGYHEFTYGLLLDQIVRRVDPKHRSLPRYFHDELAAPTSAMLYIGLPRSDFWRLARLYPTSWSSLINSISSLDFQGTRLLLATWLAATTNPLRHNASATLKPPLTLEASHIPERCELLEPSTLGFGSAVALVRLFAPLVGEGKLEEKAVLSLSAVQSWWQALFSGQDLLLDEFVSWSRGGARLEDNAFAPSPQQDQIAVLRGEGGQVVWLDRQFNLTIAYITNHLHYGVNKANPIHRRLLQAIYDCVAKQKL